MRILFLSHSPNDEQAGASRVYHMLAAELRTRGHAVELFHLEDMHVPRGRSTRLAVQRLAMPTYLSRFGASEVKNQPYDVVMSSSGMAGPLFNRLRGQPNRPLLVNHLHGLTIYDHLAAISQDFLGYSRTSHIYKRVSGPIQDRWDRYGINMSDVTVVQNLRDLSWVRSTQPRGRIVERIPAAVHPTLLDASATAVPMKRRARELLWFASWEPRKGSHFLPMAFRLVRAKYPEVHLTLGGTRGSSTDIRSEFAPEDRGSVDILPRLSVIEQIALLNRAAVFIFPSLSEGFGLALAEAMSFGLAAVSGATGFAADFLQDGRDVRISFPSSEHLARAILAFLDDDHERAAIAERGRSVARTLTIARMADGYEQVFKR